MNAKQKRFVVERLIPFILRDAGRGFAMETWNSEFTDGRDRFDGILRRAPSCGSVHCIGGSIAALKGRVGSPMFSSNFARVGRDIGLNQDYADKLFSASILNGHPYMWPERYRKLYRGARSTIAKARVAVSLLRKIVKEGPKVLDAE